MASADFHEVVDVDCDKLFETITHYEDYPEFVDGCKKVQVERKGEGKARVYYDVSMIKEISYVLDHEEDKKSGKIAWKLHKSDFVKKNKGSWHLKSAGKGKTDVHYEIEIEFAIPVPGLILNRLIKVQLPSMVKNFVKQAKSNG